MSSVDCEQSSSLQAPIRDKRGKTRACDMCRRRKMRCDGKKSTNALCSNCVTQGFKCTYVQSAPKRLPDPSYIESLEAQVSEMRTLLSRYRQLYPDGEKSGRSAIPPPLSTTFTAFSSGTTETSPSPNSATTPSGVASASTHLSPESPARRSYISISPVPTPVLTDEEPEFDSSDDEITTWKAITEPFSRLSLHPNSENFQGKSSGMMFIKAALESKHRHRGGGDRPLQEPIDAPNSSSSSFSNRVSNEKDNGEESGSPWPTDMRVNSDHPEVWAEHEWLVQATHEPPIHYIFPPPDLLEHLLSTYFSTINLFTPVFHQPTFMNDVRNGLHLHNNDFGAIVLLVCAAASRESDDPRVLLDGERAKNEKSRKENALHGMTTYSAGWKWFDQVKRTRLAVSFRQPSLYDAQIAYLLADYAPSMTVQWSNEGSGIQLAQMLGAHRKKAIGAKPTVEGELRKRVFWALVLRDRMHSASFGRSCSIQDEDFDVDLPIACDDEYWTHPDPRQAFKQPKGKPSTVAFFNCMLTLSQIEAYALRTIYSINRSKALLGLVGRDWQQRLVAQIDSALNRWLDTIPPHLRWDSKMANDLFCMQSADLHAAYYDVRIMVHRQFMFTPHGSPSLAICTNAARTSINMLDEQFRRTGTLHKFGSLFLSAVVLLVDIWSSKLPKASAERRKKMEPVRKVVRIMKATQHRNDGAVRIIDALKGMIDPDDLVDPNEESRNEFDYTPTESPPVPNGGPGTTAPITIEDHTEHLHQAYNFLIPPHPNTHHHPYSSQPTSHPLPTWSTPIPAPSTFPPPPPPPPTDIPLTTHHPTDPMIDALLGMLAPTQYQASHRDMPTSVAPQDLHRTTSGVQALWSDLDSSSSIIAHGLAGGWPGGESVGGWVSPETTASMWTASGSESGTNGMDGSSKWFQPPGPTEFAWQDDQWETYLTDDVGARVSYNASSVGEGEGGQTRESQ